MPTFANRELAQAINAAAELYSVPEPLIVAVVRVESSGDCAAWNPEPHYRWLWNCRAGEPYRISIAGAHEKTPPPGFRPPRGLKSENDAEFWGQQASWGPMQVMGAVAREAGYLGLFPGLCNPHVGVAYGARFLSTLMRRHKKRYGFAGVMRAFNTGRATDTPRGAAYVLKIGKHVDLEAL